MFKTDKKKEKENVTDVEFEDVEDLEAEVGVVDDEEETPKSEKKPVKERFKSGLKTAGKIGGGFLLGVITMVGVGVLASKKDYEDEDEPEVSTLITWGDDETSDEEED